MIILPSLLCTLENISQKKKIILVRIFVGFSRARPLEIISQQSLELFDWAACCSREEMARFLSNCTAPQTFLKIFSYFLLMNESITTLYNFGAFCYSLQRSWTHQ